MLKKIAKACAEAIQKKLAAELQERKYTFLGKYSYPADKFATTIESVLREHIEAWIDTHEAAEKSYLHESQVGRDYQMLLEHCENMAYHTRRELLGDTK